MSQPQHGYAPPPQSPRNGILHNQFRRQYPGQPPLLTTVFDRSNGYQPNTSLPVSTTSSPLRPVLSPSSATLPSTSTSMSSGSYNPRQWSQYGHAESSRASLGGSHLRSTGGNSGMESSMPSPPPPYTPPTPTQILRPGRSAALSAHDVYASSPMAMTSSSIGQSSSQPSPQMRMAPQFPPPPSRDNSSVQGERESSRPRLSLSAFTAIVTRPGFLEGPSQPNSPMLVSAHVAQRPPASRRAASTGTIDQSGKLCVVQSMNISPGSNRWNPGTPLPPPPPGPPPAANARSHSLNRVAHQRPFDIRNEGSIDPQRYISVRASHHTPLGAVPPTPAGWSDDDLIPQIQPASPMVPQLRIITDTTSDPAAMLTRRPAEREASADSILERRSRSRAGRDASIINDSQQGGPGTSNPGALPKPIKLVLSSTTPLNPPKLTERIERSDQAGSMPSTQTPIESTHDQGTARNIAALTPPYTPACKPQTSNARRVDPNCHAMNTVGPQEDRFVQSSLERFHMFIQQEASALCDRDRLELFSTFIVQESRIRRDLYSSAFTAMAGEIMDLTRDLWRPTSLTKEQETSHKVDASSSTVLDGPRRSGNIPASNASSSGADFTPATDTDSLYAGSEPEDTKAPPATPWGEKFQPSLSPINSVPSMAVSTVPDGEGGSRGRPASRWWEGSVEGSMGQGGRRLEMTKQESRYMSLHPNELIVNAQPSPSHSTPTPGTMGTSFRYGPDEYPAEKTGFYEEGITSASSEYRSDGALPPSLAWGYGGKQAVPPSLDVSRLVTLPPPYPRHYPALHNNHPSLQELRLKHREVAENLGARQSQPMEDVVWQPSVYTSMMQSCETTITELVCRLDEAAESQELTSLQTEGDERPELLEQLTLLKWIFEAREQLRKQDFDATAQRLKARSLTFTAHCRQTGEYQRLADEEARLESHLQASRLHFAEQANHRYTHLLSIIEHHVSRGVEVQLSAFWDIAPSLLEVVQRIPVSDSHELAHLSVLIPSAEIADSPSYRDFPLQYLLRTLTHAMKSAYQFIENQTNLLCLLHEIRTASMSAEARYMEMDRLGKGEDVERVKAEMVELRRRREEEETGVLKERVGILEGQWDHALGGEIEGVVQQVRASLQEMGGLDEGIDE